jgi:hypothetical protein
MNITPKKLKWFKQMIYQMREVSFEYYTICEGVAPTKVEITGFNDDNTFEATFYHMYSEGFGYEYEQIDTVMDIPYNCLTNSDWQQELRDEIWNKQQESIRKSEEKKAAAELHEQEQSLLQYELLKQRFEGKV